MAKNSKRKRSERQKLQFSMYETEGREEKNRIRALKRHLKRFPEDMVAKSALSKFEKTGVPHRRKPRTVGIRLTSEMQEILKCKGNRLSKAKVSLLGKLNNPAGARPDHLKHEYDRVNNIMSKRTKVRYKTAMRIAYEAAKEKFNEEKTL